MELNELIWDDFNSKHILKHKVTKIEVNEACQNNKLILLAKNNRILLIGKTKTNRILSVVLGKVSTGKYYVVTARDSSRKERKIINEQK